MHSRAMEQPRRPAPRYTFNFPAPMAPPLPPRPPVPQSARTSATPTPRGRTPRFQTPIKVETARQYTRLTPEEREYLARTGGCFRCRQPGHMAHQCPRTTQISNAYGDQYYPEPQYQYPDHQNQYQYPNYGQYEHEPARVAEVTTDSSPPSTNPFRSAETAPASTSAPATGSNAIPLSNNVSASGFPSGL